MNDDAFYWDWPLLRGDGLSVDERRKARFAYLKKGFPIDATDEIQTFVAGIVKNEIRRKKQLAEKEAFRELIVRVNGDDRLAVVEYAELIRSVAGKKTFDDGGPVEGFALELCGDDRRRYEEIRAARAVLFID